jgi:hypothetical protein
MRRTGIELSSSRCIVVDASASSRSPKHGERTLVRVRNFASFGQAASAQALTAELKLLLEAKAFPRRAWVTLWDIRSTHQYTLLAASRRKEIDAVARKRGTSVLGVDARGLSVGVAEGAELPAQHRIELSFFAAASEDIQNQLRPIQDAGFIVDGVAAPCGALWAQARLRRSAVPGDVHAYVALGVARSALVIVANGYLLYARELDWGYAEAFAASPTPRSRDEIATRLGGELRRSFLYVKQYWEEDVSQVLLCGEMPGIRSLTAPLIERLNIEVETLDSLDGIDTAHLPEPADQFIEKVASMRLATAVAAEPPPVNLLPVEVTATQVSRTLRLIFALGSAAAVAFGAFLHQVPATRTHAIELEVAAIERQRAAIQPRVRAVELARARSGLESAQQAALEAFETQGPRMAQILQAISEPTAPDQAQRSVHVAADGSQWRVSVHVVSPAGVRTTTEYSVPR